MRTTLNIDDDLHESVMYYARARGLTLSEAVCELIRKGENAPKPKPDIRRGPNGFPIFPPIEDATTLTEELVKDLEEEPFDPRSFA